MAQESRINKEMTFGEVLKKYPETVKTFFQYGMHCYGCHLAVDETIEQGSLAHGVEVDKLVEDLNKTLAASAEAAKDSSPDEKKIEA